MNFKLKGFLFFLSLVLIVTAAFPILSAGEKEEHTDACCEYLETALIPVNKGDEVKISTRISELFEKRREKREKLILGGCVFGAQVKTQSVSVVESRHQKELRPGDVLVKIEGVPICSTEDVSRALERSDGENMSALIKRDGRMLNITLTPKESNGEYMLGIRLKDTAAGIGTITYIDPKSGEFGGLGHGICDPESGEVIPIKAGDVMGVILGGVEKGESGKPGELSGILTDRDIGDVYANTESGLFGKLDTLPSGGDAELIEIGKRSDVKPGDAYIYSTVKNGKRSRFDIMITEVNPSSDGTKSFKIKVKDPALIAITGGIVRGMSGSPIIQDGKLVGAVTHVMVADPTEGYGIFIENMLNAANNQSQQKVA